MVNLSQNRKIAASVVVVFVASFSVMLFILKNSGQDFQHGGANLFAIGEHSEENAESDYSEVDAVKKYFDDGNPVLILNADGEIYDGSESFCSLLNLDCSKLKGKSIFDFVHERDVKDFAGAHAKIMNSDKDLKGMGPYRLSSEKAEAMVLINAHLVKNEGRADFAAISIEDLTLEIEEFKRDKDKKEKIEKSMQIIVNKISFNN